MNINILVTSYSTQASPSQMWGGEPVSLDLQSYEKILFKLKSGQGFNLIGGEPTAHPDFKTILSRTNQWCKENKTNVTLITNGTYLEQYLNSIGTFLNLIIQFADLKEFSDIKQYTDIYATLQHINELGWFESNKALCQFEIGERLHFLDHIENLLTTLNLRKIKINFPPIAFQVSPEEYYLDLKQKFLTVCELAYKYHCEIIIDEYNAIPWCYFNDSEKSKVSLVCNSYPKYSTAFRLVVLPSGICVYDRYNNMHQLVVANLNDFDDLNSLNKYLLLKIYYPIVTQPTEGRCAVCPHAKLLQCDGNYLFNPDARVGGIDDE